MSRPLAVLSIGTNSSQQTKPFRMYEADVRLIRLDLSTYCGLKGAAPITAEWSSDDAIALSNDSLSGNVATATLSATRDGTYRGKVAVELDSGETKVYLWRVEVIPAEPFPPACPVLLTPNDTAIVSGITTATVEWFPSAFATSYEVYLDEELVGTTTETEYTFTGLEADTGYVWSIIPVGVEGSPASCGFRSFYTAVPACPTLLTPSNGATVSGPEFATITWSGNASATAYRVYLDDVLVATVTELEYTFEDLDPATSYTWRVTAMYGDVESSGCASRTFETPDVECPGLLIPLNGSSVGDESSTTLLWDSVPEAEEYDVYVWENGDPQPGTPTATVTETSYEVTGLASGTTYRWLIDAVTENGHVSPGCSSNTFTTDEAPASIEWQSATFTGDILGDEVTLVAIRSGNTAISASADYTFTEGTALIGPDFVATPGTVSFGPGEVTKDVVVPLVRDYNAEVLADLPEGFWDCSQASGTTFTDLTPQSYDLTLTSTAGFAYQQADLNLAASKSVSRDATGTTWRFRADVNALIDNGDPVTICGWAKFNNTAPTSIKSLFQIGGGGSSAQFYGCWCYRNAAGTVSMGWHHQTGGGNTFITKTFTTALALDEEFWFEAGIDHDNDRVFFRKNDGAAEYVSFSASDSPNGLDHTGGRITYFNVGQRPVINSGDAINGKLSHYEMYVSVVSPNRWPRWNLDASLNFLATLSNPSANTTIGAIDETEMTIEAP